MITSKNYKKYQKQYNKKQQTNESIDNLHRKSSQDDLIHKNEYESLRSIFNYYVDARKRVFCS